MVKRLVVEILILWVCYALYMAILVHKRGPVGGIFFYPKGMQERVIALGLITAEEMKRRRNFAYGLILAWMILIPLGMILFVNGARSYWDCCWQYYVLFLGAEFFDPRPIQIVFDSDGVHTLSPYIRFILDVRIPAFVRTRYRRIVATVFSSPAKAKGRLLVISNLHLYYNLFFADGKRKIPGEALGNTAREQRLAENRKMCYNK